MQNTQVLFQLNKKQIPCIVSQPNKFRFDYFSNYLLICFNVYFFVLFLFQVLFKPTNTIHHINKIYIVIEESHPLSPHANPFDTTVLSPEQSMLNRSFFEDFYIYM